MPRVARPSSRSTRSRISSAALLVNVIARISLGLRLVGVDQEGDPVGQHARLAAAGAGEDQQRPLAVRDRLALGLVEALQQLLKVLGVRVFGHLAQHRCAPGRPPAGGVAERLSRPAGFGPLDGAQRPHLGDRLGARPRRRDSSAIVRSSVAIRLPRAPGSRRRSGRAGGSSRRPAPRRGARRRAPGGPGLPTTVEFGGTSWMTTLLAPIFAPWPIVIGPSSFAPEPIVTLSCDRRVALAGREAGAAERHALVERDVVADVGRLADHDARRRGR